MYMCVSVIYPSYLNKLNHFFEIKSKSIQPCVNYYFLYSNLVVYENYLICVLIFYLVTFAGYIGSKRLCLKIKDTLCIE